MRKQNEQKIRNNAIPRSKYLNVSDSRVLRLHKFTHWKASTNGKQQAQNRKKCDKQLEINQKSYIYIQTFQYTGQYEKNLFQKQENEEINRWWIGS